MTRKFYRTVFTVEVLSEDPFLVNGEVPNLDDVHYEVTEGHCSGTYLSHTEEIIDGPRAAELLNKQGSDPEFFGLDVSGNDLED